MEKKKKGKDILANPKEYIPTRDDLSLLKLIWSTEPMGFFDLCNAMRTIGTCPIKGDKQAWAGLFIQLGEFEKMGWIECERKGKSLESLQLTEEGAAIVRDYADNKRELLNPIFHEEKLIIGEYEDRKEFNREDFIPSDKPF